MNIGLGQLILILIIFFLLFGNFSTILFNISTFIEKIKDLINNNEKK